MTLAAAPAPGVETMVLVMLHEYGLLDAAMLAEAVSRPLAEVQTALDALFLGALVARGHTGYRSTGVWTPGRPSSERPAL